LVFLFKKRQFFSIKLAKIAENCDHNIGPWPQRFDDANELTATLMATSMKEDHYYPNYHLLLLF
jgi:hypothetical protein